MVRDHHALSVGSFPSDKSVADANAENLGDHVATLPKLMPSATDGAASVSTSFRGHGRRQQRKGTLRLLFSPLQKRHVPLLLLGVALSLTSGAIPPIMTKVLGNAFDAYTSYNSSQQPASLVPAEEKDALLNAMVQVVWHLCVLAAATMVLSTTMISIWVGVGESLAFEWRRRVYISITQKKMAWFDLGMGCADEASDDTAEEKEAAGEAPTSSSSSSSSLGAGGLMAKFARETDDVRVALSYQMGQLVQYATTAIAALVLALMVNWSLTLVILASIPIAAVLTTLVEIRTGPQLTAERAITAKASGIVERTISAITTVKAFNTQQRQSAQFQQLLDAGTKVYNKTSVWWGLRLGVSTTVMFCMFVQGFWYGSYLVQKSKASPGDVMTVFWSSILVSGHIQQIIEALNVFEKGKISALGLDRLIHDGDEGQRDAKYRVPSNVTVVQRQEDIPSSASTKVNFSESPLAPAFSKADLLTPSLSSTSYPTMTTWSLRSTSRLVKPMQRIIPTRVCKGEISLRDVTFTYPAAAAAAQANSSEEPTATLSCVNMYFPAGEPTFIVGSSGSGKSTIAQLLLRLYRQDGGTIEMDEQDMRLLDSSWCHANIASVDQHPIIFDLSVHDNVALGLTGALSDSAEVDATTHVPIVERSRIIEACRTALLHDFVKDLPQGYDTILGTHGASLSGGQKQRLSIARARLRDPVVLILDEATSALDLTSRTLIHAAVKAWRRGKTTIIITHDLSQVDEGDFLYFMSAGQVAEHGYREDLEKNALGCFARLAAKQRLESDEKREKRATRRASASRAVKVSPSEETIERLATDGDLETDIALSPMAVAQQSRGSLQSTKSSRGMAPFRYNNSSSQPLRAIHHSRTRSDASMDSVTSVASGSTAASKSLAFDAKHSDVAGAKGLRTLHITQQWHATTAEQDSPWLEAVARVAEMRRQQSYGRLDAACSSLSNDWTHATSTGQRPRRVWSQDELNSFGVGIASTTGRHKGLCGMTAVVDLSADPAAVSTVADPRLTRARLFATLSFALRTTPKKLFLALGLFVSLVSGAVTPLFSYFLAQLLATLPLRNQQATVLRYALAVLGLAFLEGIASFIRFASMEMLGGYWIAHLRQVAFDKVLSQDRAWFDEVSASPQSLVTRIIKDAEDARNLIARSLGALLTVCAMVGVALVWSMCVGWQLTLVGVALAPIYIGVLTVQSRIVAGYEARNKLRREEVAKRFYDMASNIRGIRSMALEPVFAARFYDEIVRTKKDAIRAAPFRGLGFGLGEAMTYISEALMFYVGAVLIVRGLYDFEKMVVVFNLIIFAVTFAGEILAHLPGLTQSLQATKDLQRLYNLPKRGDEPTTACHNIDGDMQGAIQFRDVHFTYPARPSVPVLHGISLIIYPGETVAVVGASGSGKSTVAALLERMYEPAEGGAIWWGSQLLSAIPVSVLRDNLALVSQTPDLFDMSIADNVAWGVVGGEKLSSAPPPTRDEVIAACMLSRAHDFITHLPKGYDTNLGEGGSLLSGGQRQRIAIARALLRVLPRRGDFRNDREFVAGRKAAKVLILDEAASALDDTTRHLLLDTILVKGRRARTMQEHRLRVHGGSHAGGYDEPITPPPVEINPWKTYAALQDLTTVLITHKLDEMKRCDRLIVLDAGKVVQQGTFEELSAVRGGTFAKLASAGEWGA